MFQNNFSYYRRSLFLLTHMTYQIEMSERNNTTQISLPTSSTMLNIYYTKFLHVSAIYPGNLQEDTSLVCTRVFCNLSQVTGRLSTYIRKYFIYTYI